VAYASALPYDAEVSIYALSCLFLAAKVTDNPRDLGSVAQAFIFDKSGIIYPRMIHLRRIRSEGDFREDCRKGIRDLVHTKL
jgi:hypothetical protein